MDKKISIIIPVYNAEKYLKRTLDSVRFQTYKNLEIICVLDCPTDGSEAIVKKAAEADNRVTLIRHEKNMGPAAGKNTGVKNATGEYIHFMDADDLISPDFYDILISNAADADADVAACSVFYERKPRRSIWFNGKNEILSTAADKIRKTAVAIQGWPWRYLIRRNFWESRRLSFPDLILMEDMPVMIPMIFYANKVVLCPSAVYFYKHREGSMVSNNYDPAREKRKKEDRRAACKISREFMRANKIKRPNIFRIYYI